MKIVLMAASKRKESYNKKLIYNCSELISSQNTKELHMNDFSVPEYDGDTEDSTGIPDKAKELADIIQGADKIIFAVPEYNGSIPGNFKNLVDWVSRVRPMPWAGKKMLLMTASPSFTGGIRSFGHAQQIFFGMGTIVFNRSLQLSSAYDKFDDENKIKEPRIEEQLQNLLQDFVEF